MAFSRPAMIDHIRNRTLDVLYDDAVFVDSLSVFGGGGIFLKISENKKITGHADFDSMFAGGVMQEEKSHLVKPNRVKKPSHLDEPPTKADTLYYIARISLGLTVPVQNQLRSLVDFDEEALAAFPVDQKKFIEFNKKGDISVDKTNPFDVALSNEIIKYEMIATFGLDSANQKRFLHNLSANRLTQIQGELAQPDANHEKILKTAFAEASQIAARRILSDAHKKSENPECNVYRDLYREIIWTDLNGQLELKQEIDLAPLKNRIAGFRNEYTEKFYHEPFRSHAHSLGLAPEEQKLDDREYDPDLKKKQLKAIHAELGQVKLILNDVSEKHRAGNFSTLNAESDQAYEAAIKIEKQILDIEDAVRDPNVTVSQLDAINLSFTKLKDYLNVLKNLAVNIVAKEEKIDEAKAEDLVNIEVIFDIDEDFDAADVKRKSFFDKFLEKMRNFTNLVVPEKKGNFRVSTRVTEEKRDIAPTADEEKRYQEGVEPAVSGWFGTRFGGREERHYWLKKELHQADTLLEAKGLDINDPRTINTKLREFDNPRVVGLNAPDSPENIAASIALLDRLKDQKAEIDKSNDPFKKDRIDLVVKTTTASIEHGISLLGDHLGQRSVFRHALNKDFKIAENEFAPLTAAMRSDHGMVSPSTFVQSYDFCQNDGTALPGDEKESAFHKAVILQDEPDIYSVHSQTDKKFSAACHFDRELFLKSDGSLDRDKIMECAAREVEAIRAGLPPDIRASTQRCHGMVLIRGASMPDEMICAIKAYCDFNGYAPVRAVLRGNATGPLDETSFVHFRRDLADVDKQLNLEQKLGIMIGKPAQIAARKTEAHEAKQLTEKSMVAYAQSKTMDESFVIKPY